MLGEMIMVRNDKTLDFVVKVSKGEIFYGNIHQAKKFASVENGSRYMHRYLKYSHYPFTCKDWNRYGELDGPFSL